MLSLIPYCRGWKIIQCMKQNLEFLLPPMQNGFCLVDIKNLSSSWEHFSLFVMIRCLFCKEPLQGMWSKQVQNCHSLKPSIRCAFFELLWSLRLSNPKLHNEVWTKAHKDESFCRGLWAPPSASRDPEKLWEFPLQAARDKTGKSRGPGPRKMRTACFVQASQLPGNSWEQLSHPVITAP